MVIAVDMLVIWALAQYLRQPVLAPPQDQQAMTS